MSESSASVTFFAARKHPRKSIERLTSTRIAVAVLANEPGVLEELGHATQLVEGLPRRGAGQPFDLVAIERFEVVRVACAADRVLHVRELVHLVHEPERFGER